MPTTIDRELEIVQPVNKWPDIPFCDPYSLRPSLNPLLIVDGHGLEKVRSYLARVNEYSIDYETNVVETFYRRRARTLQIGDRNEQYIIDLLAFAETPERLIASQGLYRDKNTVSLANLSILEPVVEVIRPSMESNSHLKVGHFLEFEYIVSKWCLGIRAWNLWCTLRVERDLSNGAVPVHQKDYFGLDDTVRRYCKFQISKEEQTGFDLCTPLTEAQIIYAALDVRLPIAIKNAQYARVERAGLKKTVQIDMDAIPAFGDMHLNGMLADPEQWTKINSDNEANLAAAIEEMDTYFVPVVGEKQMWDQGLIDSLYVAWKSYDEPSIEEIGIAEELSRCRKDKERTAELKQNRAIYQERRKQAKTVAKEMYMEERAKANAKAKDDYSKMEGRSSLNYGSPIQLLKALHNGAFGLNKKNFKESNDKAMEKHANLPVIQAIRKYRSLSKALSTYGYRWILNREQTDERTGKKGYVDPDTGRIHAKFQQCGADTGRPSCISPNMLNLPQEGRYREAFVSRSGYDMVCKDCAGQELRILTEYSQEPVWIAAFLGDKDVHSISAEMINPDLWRKSANMTESVSLVNGKLKTIPKCAYYTNDQEKCNCPKHKEVRNDYKAFNFGVVYDKSAFSFAAELGKDVKIVEAMLNAWKTKFNVTQNTLEQLRAKGYTKGEARTLAGRRRVMRAVTFEQAKKIAAERYGESYSQEQSTRVMQQLISAVKREAGNMPIQGSGADLMMLAMGAGFDPQGKPYLWHILEPKYHALLLNYVYDEFVVESPEAFSEEVSDAIEDAIIRAGAEFVKVVPMKSDGMISKRWQK